MRLNFRAKLILFALLVLLVPTVVLVAFFIQGFNTITEFSLDKNREGIIASNREFLTNIVHDQARLIEQNFRGSMASLTVLGKAAQKLIDNYDQLAKLTDYLSAEPFADRYVRYQGALTNAPSDHANVLAPTPIATSPRSRQLLNVTAFLNLVIGPVFESNESNTFVYFVGDKANPVTRAYPYIDLAKYLGDIGALEALFWRDFFAENVPPWERFFSDEQFQKQVLETVHSPVTFNPPYEDAAGQGKIITMFYPLWDHDRNQFAGVVAADVSLAGIVDTVLGVRVAQTGYAVLMNGSGEIIALSEEAQHDLKIQDVQQERGGLQYLYRSLASTNDGGIKAVYERILMEERGYLTTTMDDGENHILVFDTLAPFNDSEYQADSWKILISVPETEVLGRLFDTHDQITAQNEQRTVRSLIFVAVVVVVVILASFLVASTITRNLGLLSSAAQRIAEKNYDVNPGIKSRDEIGELGKVFTQMSQEIKGYTTHLEDMVAARTEELEKALGEISVLNERLKDENLRMSAELDIAKQLQLMVLPGDRELAEIRDLDIACRMQPADEVGGDYYDFYRANGSVTIGIGDVTGHGLAAGVIMMMAQTAIKSVSMTGQHDMKKFMGLVNRIMYSNIVRIREDKSMTLALINYRDHDYTIVGQHEAVIICRRDGRIEVMDTIDLGLFVGFEPDIDQFLGETTVRLETDDVMVLYTDGVTEAISPKNEEFGKDRLCQLIASLHRGTAREILTGLDRGLNDFISGATIHDDVSLVVIKQR